MSNLAWSLRLVGCGYDQVRKKSKAPTFVDDAAPLDTRFCTNTGGGLWNMSSQCAKWRGVLSIPQGVHSHQCCLQVEH